MVRPVYHFHLQKSAGTSINTAFFSLALPQSQRSYESGYELYLKASTSPELGIDAGGLRYRGHKPYDGQPFDYWFSHYFSDGLPEDAYTFTCLRDPVRRLRSFFAEIAAERSKGALSLWEWDGFAEAATLREMVEQARERDLNHLCYLFSPSGDMDEAFYNLIRCTRIIRTEHFAEGMAYLSADLGIDLPVFHGRASPPLALSKADTDLLHDASALDRAIMDRLTMWQQRSDRLRLAS